MEKQSDIVELLLAHRRGDLDDRRREEVEQMLAGDAELRELNRLLDGMDEVKQAGEEDSSARAAHMLAMQLYGDWLHQRHRETVKSPAPEEDTEPSQTQQTFSLDGGRVTVDISRVGDEARELLGQIHGLSPAPTFIECAAGNRRTTADVDERGAFRFANVASGEVTLSVLLDDDNQVRVTFTV